MSISERLRSIRGSLGLNQDGMTERLCLGVGAWKRLELEGRAPKGEVLTQLVEMGFSVDWLLTGAGQMRRDQGLGVSSAADTPPPVDEQLLETCIEVLETELKKAARTLPPAKKAAAIVALYELTVDEQGEARKPNPKVVFQLIKMTG